MTGFEKWFDSHVHSHYSPDSDRSPGAVCRQAVADGLAGICFTDHAEFAPGDYVPDAAAMRGFQNEIANLQAKYQGMLEIRWGIEIGYYTGFADSIQAFISRYPFDFVLGSIHVVEDRYYSMPNDSMGQDPLKYYTTYFAQMQEMLDKIELDAVGHFDLPKRYGQCETAMTPHSPLWPQIQAVFSTMLDRNVLPEVNGSGLRQSPASPYPTQELLREYVRQGGTTITLGSDGHHQGEVGYGLREAAALSRSAGLCFQAWYRERHPVLFPLPEA